MAKSSILKGSYVDRLCSVDKANWNIFKLWKQQIKKKIYNLFYALLFGNILEELHTENSVKCLSVALHACMECVG